MKRRIHLPQISSLLAILCAIHCALTPVLLSLTPVLAAWLSNAHWLEWLLMGAALLLGIVPVLHGYRVHGELRPGLLLLVGFLCVFLPHQLGAMPIWEYLFSFGGAILLVLAQIQNTQYSNRCACRLEPVAESK